MASISPPPTTPFRPNANFERYREAPPSNESTPKRGVHPGEVWLPDSDDERDDEIARIFETAYLRARTASPPPLLQGRASPTPSDQEVAAIQQLALDQRGTASPPPEDLPVGLKRGRSPPEQPERRTRYCSVSSRISSGCASTASLLTTPSLSSQAGPSRSSGRLSLETPPTGGGGKRTRLCPAEAGASPVEAERRQPRLRREEEEKR